MKIPAVTLYLIRPLLGARVPLAVKILAGLFVTYSPHVRTFAMRCALPRAPALGPLLPAH